MYRALDWSPGRLIARWLSGQLVDGHFKEKFKGNSINLIVFWENMLSGQPFSNVWLKAYHLVTQRRATFTVSNQ